MKTLFIVVLASASLLACTETWQGVKKDSKEVARSVGDAGNQLADKVKESLSSDKEKEGEK